MVVWKPTPSQVISRLIIGLIRVKSLIFVAGKAAVGNLPDLTNSPGITENIRETGLFNVACANELFPGRIIWHYIWKDTLFPDEVIFFYHSKFLSSLIHIKSLCIAKSNSEKSINVQNLVFPGFIFDRKHRFAPYVSDILENFAILWEIRYLTLQRNLIEFWLENLRHFEESHFESY